MSQVLVVLQGGYPSADVNEHEELRENVPQVQIFAVFAEVESESRGVGQLLIPNHSKRFLCFCCLGWQVRDFKTRPKNNSNVGCLKLKL